MLLKHLPNLLSLMRLLLSPLILFLEPKLAFWFFALLALSDAIDGFLARALNAESALGRAIDPIADRAMILFALYNTAFIQDILPKYLFFSVFLRDFLVILGAILVLKTSNSIPKSRFSGKFATFSLIVCILFALRYQESSGILVLIALFSVAFSLIDYALKVKLSFKSKAHLL
ncbi:MAG: CDP-alcohol phosphatidyltransferase family protein [Aquificaceae bacterium]|nr:CDP-alcohol phosphatidyltransferase family protein [Aquificaceae bacterium]MDW8237591.1 CDP-alcohol phosphatidyltransferase family protein [Aquificaceae bacterium]